MYKYTPQRLPGPGTGNYAFEPEFSLPLFCARGPGTSYRNGFRVTQPQQVYFGQQQTIVGLEGVQAGQFTSAPLIDMEQYINGQVSPGN